MLQKWGNQEELDSQNCITSKDGDAASGLPRLPTENKRKQETNKQRLSRNASCYS